MTDSDLLRQYHRDRSESAFGQLVERHLTLVYSTAARQLHGDDHQAKDIAQSVFLDLAQKAGYWLSPHDEGAK